jgi:hypothetical protein
MTTDVVAMPLSRTELAVGELAEMLARGREPSELAEAGWEHTAALMEQRRELILQEEKRAVFGESCAPGATVGE